MDFNATNYPNNGSYTRESITEGGKAQDVRIQATAFLMYKIGKFL